MQQLVLICVLQMAAGNDNSSFQGGTLPDKQSMVSGARWLLILLVSKHRYISQMILPAAQQNPFTECCATGGLTRFLRYYRRLEIASQETMKDGMALVLQVPYIFGKLHNFSLDLKIPYMDFAHFCLPLYGLDLSCS